jgi:putative transposase
MDKVNAAVNLKRLGLGIFPTIKRRSGKLDIVGTMDDSSPYPIAQVLDAEFLPDTIDL